MPDLRLLVFAIPIVAACAGEDPDVATSAQHAQRARQLEATERIAGGNDHSCALVGDGTVRCWGENGSGQLGDGTTTDSLLPRPVSGLTDAVAVTAGFDFSCALRSNGRVWCWGSNAAGALGRDPLVTPQSAVPVEVTMVNYGVVAVSAGYYFACSLHDDGTVKCWGDNDHGQLGNGDTVSYRHSPVTITGLSSVTNVAAGGWHACAARFGTVRCWGRNRNGQLGVSPATHLASNVPVVVPGMSGVEEVATGREHTCVRYEGGTVSCWGDNTGGQLGSAALGSWTEQPVALPLVDDARALALGDAFGCVLGGNGVVRCWGSNGDLQLGRGIAPDPNGLRDPGSVLTLGTVTGLGLGLAHGCASTPTGTIKCWGDNDRGQLGDSTTTDRGLPVTTSTFTAGTGATDVSASYEWSCGRRADGTVKCWGAGYGATPVAVSGLASSDIVRLGFRHGCAIHASGSVRCFGDNSEGQLGDGTRLPRPTPVLVTGLTERIVDLAIGAEHSCGLGVSGQVFCWGSGDFGQLGDGAWVDRATAVAVNGATDAVAIASGDLHTCAVRVGGQVSCWGNNSFGQLGNGGTTSSGIPVNNSVKTAIAVGAGLRHTCAVLNHGGAQCWGENLGGQIGNNTTTPFEVQPRTVSNLSGAVDIAGGDGTCALMSDGTVKCWGQHHPASPSLVPVAIAGVASAVRLGVGAWHACATRGNGTIVCWGLNSSGELGNGAMSAGWRAPVQTIGFP